MACKVVGQRKRVVARQVVAPVSNRRFLKSCDFHGPLQRGLAGQWQIFTRSYDIGGLQILIVPTQTDPHPLPYCVINYST
jgi:hypothetical protein